MKFTILLAALLATLGMTGCHNKEIEKPKSEKEALIDELKGNASELNPQQRQFVEAFYPSTSEK